MFAYCNNNPVNHVDTNGNRPEYIGDPNYEWAWEFGWFLCEKHFNRNENNPDFPSEFDAEYFGDWDDTVAAYCHQFSAPERDNKKYVSADGKFEAIYDSSGHLVTDPRDVGTYNYASPNDNPVGHLLVDVLPWIFFGNSPDDTTNPFDRILGSMKIYLD